MSEREDRVLFEVGPDYRTGVSHGISFRAAALKMATGVVGDRSAPGNFFEICVKYSGDEEQRKERLQKFREWSDAGERVYFWFLAQGFGQEVVEVWAQIEAVGFAWDYFEDEEYAVRMNVNLGEYRDQINWVYE